MIIEISLVTICHQSYYNIIDYIPHVAHFIPVTHLFCNWKFIPHTLPKSPYFTHPPVSLSSGNHPFVLCICESASVLLCFSICFVF